MVGWLMGLGGGPSFPHPLLRASKFRADGEEEELGKMKKDYGGDL